MEIVEKTSLLFFSEVVFVERKIILKLALFRSVTSAFLLLVSCTCKIICQVGINL